MNYQSDPVNQTAPDMTAYMTLVNLLTKQISPDLRAQVLSKLTEINNTWLKQSKQYEIDIDAIIDSLDMPQPPTKPSPHSLVLDYKLAKLDKLYKNIVTTKQARSSKKQS